MKKIKKRPQGTKEPQYNRQVHDMDKYGPATMGLTTSYFWRHDPKHLLFTLGRYKFVAKMVIGKKRVAEVGCGDAFGARLLASQGTRVDGYDFDPVFIDDARRVNADVPGMTFAVHDILKKPLPKKYEAVYALDVIEHIVPKQEKLFMKQVLKSILHKGMLILGSPNVTSQKYASAPSREGHVNCKTHDELRAFVATYFSTVLLFSMNDEVGHTGFGSMAHYLFVIGVDPKKR